MLFFKQLEFLMKEEKNISICSYRLQGSWRGFYKDLMQRHDLNIGQ